MSAEIDLVVAAGSSYDEDGHLEIQPDVPGLGSEGTTPAEALSPNGVHARPVDPEKDDNGQVGLGEGCLMITVGDRRYVIPIGDPRDIAESRIPRLKKGGKMLAGGAGDHRSFVVIDGEDPAGEKAAGSIMISASYTKAGAKKSLGLSFNVRDAGSEDVSLVHGDGARLTMNSAGTTITSPNGENYFEVGDDGIVLAGAVKAQGSFTAGSQLGADNLVLAKPLILLLGKLISITAAITAVTAGAPAAALAGELAGILSKHTKGS
jgi:hypothetical protein